MKLFTFFKTFGNYNQVNSILEDPTALINKQNDNEGLLDTFLNNDLSHSLAIKIDESFNLQNAEEEKEPDNVQAQNFQDKVKEREETNKKEVEDFENLIVTLVEENGMSMDEKNPTYFSHIAKRLDGIIGSELNRRIFYKVQAIYNKKANKKVNRTYEATVQGLSRFEAEGKRVRQQNAKKVTSDGSLDIVTIEERNLAIIRARFLEENNKLLPEDVVFEIEQDGDKEIVYTSAKAMFPATSIAFKTLDYTDVYNPELKLLDKKTAGPDILPVDPMLMIQDGIKEGDEVTFFVETKPVVKKAADGSIIKYINKKNNNGVWYTEIHGPKGVTVAESTVDSAPIGIAINGTPLKEAYVHLPSFINSSNVAKAIQQKDKLKQEHNTLVNLRTAILNGKDVKTKVLTRGRGHLYRKGKATTSKNLPNVRIGIYTGNSFLTGDGEIMVKHKSHYIKGASYALIPEVTITGEQTFMPYGLLTKNMNNEQADILAQVVAARFTNEEALTPEQRKLIKTYKEDYDLDIRSYDDAGYLAFNNFLKNIINITLIKNDKVDFREQLSEKQGTEGREQHFSQFHTGKGVHDGAVFKAGKHLLANIELEIGSRGSSRGLDTDEKIEEAIGILKKVLTNTRMSFNRASNLGKSAHIPFYTECYRRSRRKHYIVIL